MRGKGKDVAMMVAREMRPWAFDDEFWRLDGRRIPGQTRAKRFAIAEARRALVAVQRAEGREATDGRAV